FRTTKNDKHGSRSWQCINVLQHVYNTMVLLAMCGWITNEVSVFHQGVKLWSGDVLEWAHNGVIIVDFVSDQPVAAARTIAMVRDGKIPVRLCNIHPYSVFIGRYQKLGQLYEVNSPDIYGCRDLGLVMKTAGIVE
ncbi:hypothetical protein M9458_054080, partial [Cirrhinus mrigala]